MKKLLIAIFIVLLSKASFAQSQEAQQLLLNWEKLTQFKSILQDMYKGWQVVQKGYTHIRDISSGNFSLHKGFLDALTEVSPVVKSYRRITDIIRYQAQIVKQYQRSFQQFRDDAVFTPAEIEYIAKVYANLFSESLKNLDELLMVITAGQLRMSDEERILAIDRIFSRVEDQFSFLQDFNSSTGYLSLQRKRESSDINLSLKILGY